MNISALAGRRVLITGATGFIGGRLVEVLSLGSATRIVTLVRNPARAARIACFPVELMSGDINQLAEVERAAQDCEVIFHCAYNNEGHGQINVKATRNVIEAAAAAGVRRVVQISTIEVYEPVDGPLGEESPHYAGKGMYRQAKLEAERLALAEGARLGVEVSVIQPGVVYGPYGAYWTIRPLQEMATGQVVLIDGGTGLCNAVYVDDVVAALLLAATRREAVGETFLISAAEPVTWADFYGTYECMLGRPALVSIPADKIPSEQPGSNGRVGTLTYLAHLWRDDPDFRRELRNTSTVQALYKLGHQIIPTERWQRIRRQVGVSDAAPAPAQVNGHGSAMPPLHWPGPVLIDLLTRRSKVDITKASRLLGYRPCHTLTTGMRLTEAWARWSGLC